jgi:hypothetical protein
MGLYICWESVDCLVRGTFYASGRLRRRPPSGEVLPALPVDSVLTVCASRTFTPSPRSRRSGTRGRATSCPRRAGVNAVFSPSIPGPTVTRSSSPVHHASSGSAGRVARPSGTRSSAVWTTSLLHRLSVHIVNLMTDPKERLPDRSVYLHSWTLTRFGRLLAEFKQGVAKEPSSPPGHPWTSCPNNVRANPCFQTAQGRTRHLPKTHHLEMSRL